MARIGRGGRGTGFDDWLDVYAQAWASPGTPVARPCPACGRTGLRLVFRLMRGSGDVGMPLLWCQPCLLGIALCPVPVPEGAHVVAREGPESGPRRGGVPDFRLVAPE